MAKNLAPILFEEAKLLYSPGSHVKVIWKCPSCLNKFIKTFKQAFISKYCRPCNNRQNAAERMSWIRQRGNPMTGKTPFKAELPKCIDCTIVISSRLSKRCMPCTGKLKSLNKQSRIEKLSKLRLWKKQKWSTLTEEQRDFIRSDSQVKKQSRLKSDINFKLKHYLRSRLNRAIKGTFKNGSAVQDLGCSIKDFQVYIEQQFKPGMTWNNWGSIWHLDHRKPLALFDLSNPAQFKEAVHFTNYQPMLKQNNQSKGGRLPKVYFLFGLFGSGKTTLVNKLRDLYHVYSYDEHRRHPVHEMCNPLDFTKPILYESPVLVSSFFKLADGLLEVVPVYLNESIETVLDRIQSREGKVTIENLVRRKFRLDSIFSKFSNGISGTADELVIKLSKINF